jgi:hypothetical protein
MTEITTPRAGEMGQLSDAERELFEALGPAFEEERVRVAKLLASKADRELFGETEFELRERVHRLGAASLEEAAKLRQKKGGLRGC